MSDIRQREWTCITPEGSLIADVWCGPRHIACFGDSSIAHHVVAGHNSRLHKRRPDGDDVGDEQ